MFTLITKKRFMIGCFLILLITMFIVPIASANNPETTKGSLQVTGQAVVTGTPDVAFITLGVETSNLSASIATQENADRMAKVFEALKALGLQDEELTTSSYNIYSSNQILERGTKDEKIVTTYKVQNRLKITTTNLDNVGKIVDVAIDAGANQVQGIQFDIKNKQDMKLQALKNAVTQAKAKAEVMADVAGIHLGGLVSMNENYGSYAPMVDYGAMTLRADVANMSTTAINPGQIEVSASVSLNFWY